MKPTNHCRKCNAPRPSAETVLTDAAADIRRCNEHLGASPYMGDGMRHSFRDSYLKHTTECLLAHADALCLRCFVGRAT